MKLTLTSTLIASGIALATLTGAAQAKGRLNRRQGYRPRY